MQKITNYKVLCKLSRQIKQKERLSELPNDSFDQLNKHQQKVKSKKIFNHLRSHSCPFIEPKNDSGQSLLEMLQKTEPKLKQKPPKKQLKKKFHKPHKYEPSKLTQSTNPRQFEQISLLSYPRISPSQPTFGKIKLTEKSQDCFINTKIHQQIEIYQLKEKLQKAQKQAKLTKIRFNFLENACRNSTDNLIYDEGNEDSLVID